VKELSFKAATHHSHGRTIMACEDIARRPADLRSEKKGLEELLPNLQGAGLQAVPTIISTHCE